MTRPKIYLAGPAVFFADATDQARAARAACADRGFEGLFPCDNLTREQLADTDQARLSRAIYQGNLALMREADAAIADIRPWRGPSLDAGTAFEIGYMAALGKPVIAWTADQRTFLEKVEALSGPLSMGERGPVDRDGTLVEDFGDTDNLMIARAVVSVERCLEDALEAVQHLFSQPIQ